MKLAEELPTLHVYTRVSTSAQEDGGTSLASQEQMGRERARVLGFGVKVWNEGGKSSNSEEISDRPKLQALLSEISSGNAKHVFVYEQSRLSRNDYIASTVRYQFKKHGVTLYTKDGQYDFSNSTDNFLKQILDAASELDNSQRAERSRIGKLQRVRENRWHGGPPVFGYKLENRRLVVEKTEAAAVLDMFQRYAAGESTLEIKRYLDKGNVLPRRGGTWSLGSILKIFQNTHYIGYYNYRDSKSGEEFRVVCDPIVSNILWQQVKERRAQTLLRKGQINRTTHFYLLRDLMYCGFCGTPIGGRTKPQKHEHFYYCPHKERVWGREAASTNKHSKKNGCGFSRSMNIDQADALVWNTAVVVHGQSGLLNSELKGRLADGFDSVDEDSLKRNQKSIKAAERALRRADEALISLDVERRLKKIEASHYANVRERLLEERNSTAAQVEALQTSARNSVQVLKWRNWVDDFGDKRVEKLKLTPEQKRQYLQGIIERIDVRYLPETKQHELEIKFVKAIAADRPFKTSSMSFVQKGVPTKRLLLGTSPEVKRLAPVGKHSITVE